MVPAPLPPILADSGIPIFPPCSCSQALHNWSATLMVYLGMRENYAYTLTHRMITTAQKEYRLASISDLRGKTASKKTVSKEPLKG